MDNNKENITPQEEEINNYQKYSELLDQALKIAEDLMLNEKAANGEDVVVSVDGKILKIPAQTILDEWDNIMDLLNTHLWKNPQKQLDTQTYKYK